MKKVLFLLSVIGISFFAVADTVTTCSNSCVITQGPGGIITIVDCCGGRVITIITNPEPR